MPDNFCVNHIDNKAVGICKRCGRFFCAICLDMDVMGQPICPDCMKRKPGEAAPKDSSAAPPPPAVRSAAADPFAAWSGSKPLSGAPPVVSKPTIPPVIAKPSLPPLSSPKPEGPTGSPLNFKNKGMEDDPFGLFGTPKSSPPSLPKVTPPTDKVMDDESPSSPSEPPLGRFTPSPVIPSKADLPDLDFSAPLSAPRVEPSKVGTPKPMPLPRPIMPQPSAAPPEISMLPLGPETKPAPSLRPEPPPPSLSVPPSYGEVPLTDPLPQAAHPLGKGYGRPNALIVVKQWLRFFLHKVTGVLEPASKKLHIPAGVLTLLVLLLLAGGVIGLAALMPASAVKLVDSIPPIHIVEVSASQITDMDITAYSEFQNQLQTMGFTDILQFTLPQLPNSNFMDVSVKPDVYTYGEIVKFPSTIAPKVSFVTIFTNGVWYSTNGWEGDNVENAWRVSEFYPTTPPDQLYVKHVQRVQQMISDNGWQSQAMNENRYMAALSDELRTVLTTGKIEAYKLTVAQWH